MKHYFLKNVINQIIRKKSESIVIFSIVFIMTLFLSLVNFFGYNESMETNIADTLSLRYEIENNHVFSSTNSGINNYEYKYEYFEKIINWIDQVGKHDDIAYVDYNIRTNLTSEYNKINGLVKNYQTFGISNSNYLFDNNIELKEGRFFTQAEINEGKYYIVVSDVTTKKINGKQEKVKVGDSISLGIINEEGNIINRIKFEVIGIYKYLEQSVYYEQSDSFVNSQGILVSNKILFDYISLYNEIMDYSINHICFYLNDYNDYVNFEEKLKLFIKKFEENIKDMDYISSNIEINDTNIGSIIQSVKRIKKIYQIIFIIVFFIVSLILISNIYYLLKRKTAEMSVYYSLGQSKLKIGIHYILTYLIIGFMAIFIGIIVGYIISNSLSTMMLIDNVKLQKELLMFSNRTLDFTVENIKNISFDWKIAINVGIEILAIITFSVIGSIQVLLKNTILSRNGGWNS